MALREPANRSEDLLHGGSITDNVCGSLNARFSARCGNLYALGLGALDGCHHLINVKRFGEVFERAFFVGADGAIEVRVGRRDDDGQVGLLRFYWRATQCHPYRACECRSR